jgi:hypothetical protein
MVQNHPAFGKYQIDCRKTFMAEPGFKKSLRKVEFCPSVE